VPDRIALAAGHPGPAPLATRCAVVADRHLDAWHLGGARGVRGADAAVEAGV